MKYIKLFEQFDENDPFGEESRNIEGPIIVSRRQTPGMNYYIANRIVNNKVYFFKKYPIPSNISSEEWEIIENIDDNATIKIYDADHEFEGGESTTPSWKKYKYKDLPQEIKNKLK